MGKTDVKYQQKTEEAKSEPTKPKSWKNTIKLAVVGMVLFEGIKTIIIKSSQSQNVFSTIMTFLGSIFLLIFSFLLSICLDDLKTGRNRIIKEILQLGSFLLFLFTLQEAYIDQIQDGKSFLDMSAGGATAFIMFTAIISIQELMNMTIISQILTSIYFVIFILGKKYGCPDTMNGGHYISLISPAIHLILIFFLKHAVREVKAPIQLPFREKRGPPFLEMIDESVFTCDKNGEFILMNPLCVRNVTYKNESEFLTKVEELKLINEDKLDTTRFKVLTQILENREAEEQISPTTVPKQKSTKQVVLNIGVDPMANLSSLVKTTLVSIAAREFNEAKLFKYDGEIKREGHSTAHIHIKLYVLPQHKDFPVIIVIKNNPYKKDLDLLKGFELMRSGIMSSFYNELSRLNELSKSTVRYFDQVQSFSTTKSEEKVESVSPSLFVSMAVISRMIDDNIEFCSSKITDFKFRYTKCNIRVVLEATLNIFQGFAKIKKVNLIYKQQESQNDAEVITDIERLAQLLIQLIYNALKFTQHDSITLALSTYGKTFKITLEDPGTEISEPELIQINDDLANNQASYTKLFSKKQVRNRDLLVANSIALGLGRKPLSGLNIKSQKKSGTTIWFFIEDQTSVYEPPKSERNPLSSGLSGHKPLRPSMFKMTFEYNSKDSMNSYSELSESIEVGNLSNSSLDKLSHRGQIPSRVSPRRLSHPPLGENLDVRKSNISNSVINELPDSMSSRGEDIVIISKDEEESNKIAEIAAAEGYTCINISSWKSLDTEVRTRHGRVFLIILDLELLSNINNVEEVKFKIQQFKRNYGASVAIAGIQSLIKNEDINREVQKLFTAELLTKPLDKQKIVRLIRQK